MINKKNSIRKSHSEGGWASIRRWFSQYTEEVLVTVIVLVLLAISPLFSPVFFSVYNIATLARQLSFDILPSLGQLLVVLTAGIDLSVGAVMRTAQLASIYTIGETSVVITFLVALLVGAFIGALNGLIIVIGRLEPFIVTLGMWTILDGLALLITNGQGIAVTAPDAFTAVGSGFLGPVPHPVIITIFIIAVIAVLLHKSAFGRKIYSVGDNEVASYYSGININAIKISVFVISGILAALTGFILAARTGGFQPTTISAGGSGAELATIAAVVVGGARLTGGRGTVLGTVMGATLTGLLFNLLVLAGIDPYIQYLILGLIILGALLLSAARRSRGV